MQAAARDRDKDSEAARQGQPDAERWRSTQGQRQHSFIQCRAVGYRKAVLLFNRMSDSRCWKTGREGDKKKEKVVSVVCCDANE